MMKKILFTVIILLCSVLFFSCTSEIGISLNKDGSVDVRFEGVSGVAFATLIRSAAGVEEGDVVFDTREITAELTKNNFSSVNAVSKKIIASSATSPH